MYLKSSDKSGMMVFILPKHHEKSLLIFQDWIF